MKEVKFVKYIKTRSTYCKNKRKSIKNKDLVRVRQETYRDVLNRVSVTPKF